MRPFNDRINGRRWCDYALSALCKEPVAHGRELVAVVKRCHVLGAVSAIGGKNQSCLPGDEVVLASLGEHGGYGILELLLGGCICYKGGIKVRDGGVEFILVDMKNHDPKERIEDVQKRADLALYADKKAAAGRA